MLLWLHLIKKLIKLPEWKIHAYSFTTAFLTVFVFVVAKQGFHFDINTTDILPLLFLGLVNTGIGCYLYFSSIGSIKIQTVAILGYLEPLSAVIFSVIFLQEQMILIQIIGAGLIIGGAVYTTLKDSKTAHKIP